VNLGGLAVTAQEVPLYLELEWQLPGEEGGQSASRFFALAATGREDVVLSSIPELGNSLPAIREQEPSPRDPKQAGGTATSTGGDVSGGGGGGAPTTLPTGIDASSGGTSSSSPAPGLATGAIAGIAVACGLIFLALVGALVWFLLRRRRRADGSVAAGGYGNGRPSHRRTADLIAEKEATAGVTEAPHSPYSEDGHHNADRALAGGAAGEPLRNEVEHNREFSPYTDAPPGSSPAAASADPDLARGAAPSQMSGRYAHLIEEGMTPEQIANLEEEERALDAAIERAAGSQQSPRR